MQHLLKNKDPSRNYSIGQDLFKPHTLDFLLVGSYINIGIIEPQRIVTWYESGRVEISDRQGKALPGAKLTATESQKVLRLLGEFYQR